MNEKNTEALVNHINNYASKSKSETPEGEAKSAKSVLDIRMLGAADPPDCYTEACDVDLSSCHATCSSEAAPYCLVERRSSGEKVGQCVQCWADNQCVEPPNLRCDANNSCQPGRILPKFLQNDLKADSPPHQISNQTFGMINVTNCHLYVQDTIMSINHTLIGFLWSV